MAAAHIQAKKKNQAKIDHYLHLGQACCGNSPRLGQKWVGPVTMLSAQDMYGPISGFFLSAWSPNTSIENEKNSQFRGIDAPKN